MRERLVTPSRRHPQYSYREIPWAVMAAVLVVARLCAPSSELRIAESWFAKTALDDLLGIAAEKINDDRIYRALDALLPHKEALCQHPQQRYGALFGKTCGVSSSATLPRPISRGAGKDTCRRSEAAAGTADPIARKSASG